MNITRTDDELKIRNTLARLAHATDRGDLSEYAALLSSDARWVMPGADPVVGSAAIVSAAEARRHAGQVGPGSHTRHILSNIVVELDGDTARTASYWQFLSGTDATPTTRSSGVYSDTFVRTEAGWLFAERISVIE